MVGASLATLASLTGGYQFVESEPPAARRAARGGVFGLGLLGLMLTGLLSSSADPAAPSTAAGAGARPNVVVVMTDDQTLESVRVMEQVEQLLADDLVGDGGSDTMRGLEGDDDMFGGGVDDTILGGAGNDDISGGNGRDGLFGEGGDDEPFGASEQDALNGGPDIDACDGGSSEDIAEECETTTDVP